MKDVLQIFTAGLEWVGFIESQPIPKRMILWPGICP